MHYLQWPDGERWELISGTAWNMSPAPSRAHQALLGRLHLLFGTWLTGKPCQVYLAPFDIVLPADPYQPEDEVDTVVQPDLSVFCDPGRLTEAGAREYWVVDPAGSVQIYLRDTNGRFGDPEILVKTGTAVSHVLEGFTVEIAELFSALSD